jgi:hypothetical protein
VPLHCDGVHTACLLLHLLIKVNDSEDNDYRQRDKRVQRIFAVVIIDLRSAI